jgi:hypothetical protein
MSYGSKMQQVFRQKAPSEWTLDAIEDVSWLTFSYRTCFNGKESANDKGSPNGPLPGLWKALESWVRSMEMKYLASQHVRDHVWEFVREGCKGYERHSFRRI